MTDAYAKAVTTYAGYGFVIGLVSAMLPSPDESLPVVRRGLGRGSKEQR